MTLWRSLAMHRVLQGAAIAGLAAVILFVSFIHDFLAISEPVHANVLVFESWAWKSAAMQEAAEEFRRGQYDVVLAVGVFPGIKEGELMQENDAARAAEQLRKLGVGANAIEVLAVPNIDRHRTYASALAVKRWLADSKIDVVGINVFTIGAHARKSLVLFKRALGAGGGPVGVIAGTEDGYDTGRWWLSMRGIYTVLRKTVGYLYAECWPLPDDLPVSIASLGGS